MCKLMMNFLKSLVSISKLYAIIGNSKSQPFLKSV